MFEIEVENNTVYILIGSKTIQTIQFESSHDITKFLVELTHTHISNYVY